MQWQVMEFFEKCFVALGWGYSQDGRHIDTADVEKHYMQNGCFWCLFANQAHHLYKKYGFKQIDKYNNNEYADVYFELKLIDCEHSD
ncbi:GNAT family N-acetyltransferase [[Clostridium] fimetarium]|uniref:Uncharacterized protein n=1 Tax=[Clostridium] fimetarium TaxID=99656 RepID=A0A1I0MEY4_9FIRM|nr:hypothetical protein [[Clostridium] fimetarium]SEV86943.1 hypothetical protein SAMN05421659_101469 [[Clostridium] fimetarium]